MSQQQVTSTATTYSVRSIAASRRVQMVRGVPGPVVVREIDEATFIAALRRLRDERGISIRQLARASDVPSSTVGGYFTGRHLPTYDDQFDRVLVALGMTHPGQRALWRAQAQRLVYARRSTGRTAQSERGTGGGAAPAVPVLAPGVAGEEALTSPSQG